MSYNGGAPYRPQSQIPPQYTSSDTLWTSQQAPRPPQPAQHPQQAQSAAILPSTVTLTIRQQPVQALATSEGKEKTRKPIDPPPVVKMEVDERADPSRIHLYSPHLFVIAALVPDGADGPSSKHQRGIIGETCSAIHRLKDLDNKESGYFVFGDISIRKPGRYRLLFSLFNNEHPNYTLVSEVLSDTFQVLSSKDFHGMDESTVLSRSFNEQGVRLRMRKEPRSRQIAAYQPEPPEADTPDHRMHHIHNDYAMQQYSQRMYNDERGLKRRREDEFDVRVPAAQMPRTQYYQPPYQAPTTSTHQYTPLALPTQHYSVQHMLPSNLHHQPALSNQHYLSGINNLDPEIFK